MAMKQVCQVNRLWDRHMTEIYRIYIAPNTVNESEALQHTQWTSAAPTDQ